MDATEDTSILPPMKFDGTVITHRLIRHARRTAETTTIREGKEPTSEKTVWYEAVCACGQVFIADTDQVASYRYLDHLPKPKARKE